MSVTWRAWAVLVACSWAAGTGARRIARRYQVSHAHRRTHALPLSGKDRPSPLDGISNTSSSRSTHRCKKNVFTFFLFLSLVYVCNVFSYFANVFLFCFYFCWLTHARQRIVTVVLYRPATASPEITYDNCKIPLETSSSSRLELRFRYQA